jgi:hypothetical protein
VRDLSLHILDLIENSIRATATAVTVRVCADAPKDLLTIAVEDNGPGLRVPAEQALDPFYTTKTGKRTGLGLCLFQAAAQRAGGDIRLYKSPLGGLAVEATMQLSHVDRAPLGDLPGTISSVVCTDPGLDLVVEIRCAGRTCRVSARQVAAELAGGQTNSNWCFKLARQVCDRLKETQEAIGICQ